MPCLTTHNMIRFALKVATVIGEDDDNGDIILYSDIKDGCAKQTKPRWKYASLVLGSDLWDDEVRWMYNDDDAFDASRASKDDVVDEVNEGGDRVRRIPIFNSMGGVRYYLTDSAGRQIFSRDKDAEDESGAVITPSSNGAIEGPVTSITTRSTAASFTGTSLVIACGPRQSTLQLMFRNSTKWIGINLAIFKGGATRAMLPASALGSAAVIGASQRILLGRMVRGTRIRCYSQTELNQNWKKPSRRKLRNQDEGPNNKMHFRDLLGQGVRSPTSRFRSKYNASRRAT
eukprot:jgi/Psemu1/36324/gm1.36324_g